MNKIKRQVISLILVLCVCIANFSFILSKEGRFKLANKQAVGNVIFTIEKFTLGQGYYLEPISVPFYKDEKLGTVLARTLKSGSYNDGKDSDNIGYLDNLYDPNPGAAEAPEYILDKLDELDEKEGDWLGSGDYSMMSGWMFTLNNTMGDKMLSEEACKDGDVVRLQFTLYGFGADLGFGSDWGGPALIEAANKDQLTKLMAYINGRSDKEDLLSKPMPDEENATVGDFYETALEALKWMEADQDTVDEVYNSLKKAIEAYGEPAGEITVAVEKFTLGQGYIVEPINVPFYEGEMVGQVMGRVIGSGNYNLGIDDKDNNISYLTSIHDKSNKEVKIPQLILDQIGTVKSGDEWLGDNDYSDQVCWMYYVNQKDTGKGMSSYPCKDGDVIRLQLSLYGWGADLGYGSDWGGPALIDLVSKSNLTKLVATINSDEKKDEILSKSDVKVSYDNALAVLKQLDASKEQLDDAYSKLKKASGISIVEVQDFEQNKQPSKPAIKDTDQSMKDMLAAISLKYASSANEWQIMDMIAYGQGSAMSQSALDRYVEETKESLKSMTKSTDLSKTAIIFTALGIDAKAVMLGDGEEFNIIDQIVNGNITSISDAVFALIALDSGKYEVSNAKWDREKLIQEIKTRQLSDNGWTYWGDKADPDMTGMALSALAPYYLEDADTYNVSECVEKAIVCLENLQEDDGTFASWGTKNTCSTAMAVIALSSLGIDAQTDARFIKNEKSAIDGLVSFETEDHLFANDATQTEADAMATEQGFRALVAYNGFKNTKSAFSVYRFASVITETENSKIYLQDQFDVNDVDPNVVYIIPSKVNTVVKTTPSIIQIEGLDTKVTTMSGLTVKKKKGNQTIKFTLAPETQISASTDWDGNLILPTVVEQEKVGEDKVAFAIKVGGNVDLTLDKPARILVPEAKDSRVGYIGADGQFVEITQVMNEDTASGLTEDMTEGKIVVGNDVAIWTKHFTVFVVLEKAQQIKPPSSGGSETNKDITVYFELRGDSKHGEGKHSSYSTWISSRNYSVDKGTTVKEVFERALSNANISYTISSGSYVSEINGLGELDNGPRSGWMYKVNGRSPSVSFDQYVLNDGDTIVWYYTDDYTKEEGNSGVGGGAGNLEDEKLLEEEEQAVAEENQETLVEPLQFEDVPETHWAKEYIDYLSSRSIIKGKDEDHFGPNEKVTRAEFVMLLYRMSGEKVEDLTTEFTDVNEVQGFNEAIAWAVKAGVTNGMGNNLFAPNKEITREQMAVMLAKFAAYMKAELAQAQEKATFVDDDKISNYAKESVTAMQQAGIIQGREKSNFAPKDAATRAETAKMLAVFLEQINK